MPEVAPIMIAFKRFLGKFGRRGRYDVGPRYRFHDTCLLTKPYIQPHSACLSARVARRRCEVCSPAYIERRQRNPRAPRARPERELPTRPLEKACWPGCSHKAPAKSFTDHDAPEIAAVGQSTASDLPVVARAPVQMAGQGLARDQRPHSFRGAPPGAAVHLGTIQRAETDRHALDFDRIAVPDVSRRALERPNAGDSDSGPQFLGVTFNPMENGPSGQREDDQDLKEPGPGFAAASPSSGFCPVSF